MYRNLNKLFFAILSSFFLWGCHFANQENSGKTHFLDLSGEDTSVSPGQNFFLFANGNWLKHTQIPPSQTGWGSFYIVRDNALKEMRIILDSCAHLTHPQPGSIGQKVGDLYASAMDSATIEKLGDTPLISDLMVIQSIKDPAGIIAEVCREYNMGGGSVFSFYGAPDDRNSNMEVAHFDQGGLGLPNRDYYFKVDSNSVKIRNAYLKYIATIFILTGDDSSSSKKEALAVLNLETALAQVSKNPVQLRDPIANYHKMTLTQLDHITPNLNWANLVSLLKVKQDTVLVGQPGFYQGLSTLLHKIPVQDWKSYLKFHEVDGYTPYLSTPFVQANFEFYGRLLNGQKQMQPRWKRMCSMVDGELGDALGQLYVQRFFPPQAKKRMLQLVNNLQQTFENRLEHLDWMSDSTRQKAVAKLKAYTKKIGYPDKWKDYSSVKISRDKLIPNLQQCDLFEHNRMLHKIGRPVDRSEWGMTPPTVNAYYNPLFNEIVFPAGILQPPFFFKDADDAVNYGAIGAVIGHEMTHGLDDQGRFYDAQGNLKNWWTPQDSARFKQKANLVIQQYDQSVILDSIHVNGELTLGENIADIGGLAIAYNAFKNTPEGKSDTTIDGLTPDQRFFLSFAQIWRIKNTVARMLFRIANDPHSPEMYRVDNPVSNLVPFYNAFNVKPGDHMYRPDSLRVHIW
ncbi:MAG: M13 family metallopeptidase [Chitinophagaceae bacterium]